MNTKIFIHGLESSNKGTKAVFFREKFPDMIIPYFRGDLDTRMLLLRQVLEGKSSIVIVGSSFGGLMASLFALEEPKRVEKLILLAPAINYLEPHQYEGRVISLPVWIYHGTNDEVIPIDQIRPVAAKLFSNLTFNEVEDDHFLHNTFKAIPWDEFLA